MSLISGPFVNMDGSDTPGYRYKMPSLAVKQEGTSKMKKSILLNLSEVSRAVGRPAEHLLTYLGQTLGATTKMHKNNAYVTGRYDAKDLQPHILAFIQSFVMCRHCNNPETTCGFKGSKKNKDIFLTCKSCGRRSHLDSTDRFVKSMVKDLPPEAIKGHAQLPDGAAASAMASIANLVDEKQIEEKEQRKKHRNMCPNASCGHKTNKAVCSKCGANMIVEGNATEPVQSESMIGNSNYLKPDGSCQALVKKWMHDHNNSDDSHDLLPDFHASMRSYRTLPEQQLGPVLHFLVQQTCADGNLTEKLQPVKVSKEAGPVVKRWSSLINDLYTKVSSQQDAVDAMISAISAAVADIPTSEPSDDCILLGFLLSLRDGIDAIKDKELLSGCRRLPNHSKAMKKFIEFLEDDEDDEEGSEKESEKE